MTVKQINLMISVGSSSNFDLEDLEEIARELTDDLNELDFIDSVEPFVSGSPPKGAKGLSVDFSTVLVKIAEFGGISALITTFGVWLARDKSRTLKLQLGDKSLELTGLSKSEQDDLVRWFRQQAGLKIDQK